MVTTSKTESAGCIKTPVSTKIHGVIRQMTEIMILSNVRVCNLTVTHWSRMLLYHKIQFVFYRKSPSDLTTYLRASGFILSSVIGYTYSYVVKFHVFRAHKSRPMYTLKRLSALNTSVH